MRLKKKFLLILLVLGLIFIVQNESIWATSNNLANPNIIRDPIIKWGNSSFHDSLGIRDPYVIEKDSYYLYYDCIEDFLNPSFEPNLTTNGWSSYKANISTTSNEHFKGQSSLKMVTEAVSYTGAFTDDYYYDLNNKGDSLAMPGGLEVMPETNYVASAYVKALPGTRLAILIQEFRDDPEFFSQNKLSPASIISSYWDNQNKWYKSEIVANSNWQRVWVPFQTQTETRAVTISLVSVENKITISYWDAVQLEKVKN